MTSLSLSSSISVARSRVADYVELTKPRLTALALFAVGVGFVLGAPGGAVDVRRLLVTLVGAALIGGGGQALNQWWEREADALMSRTRTRPLPSGRLQPAQALRFGLALSAVGLGLLQAVHPLAALIGALTLLSYVAVYTPLKRVTTLCTVVGAVPGALPPVLGWAAAAGYLSLEAWVVCAILFLWQLPHFLAIAWLHREEYARAGFRMLPVVDPDGGSTARQLVCYGLALLIASLMPAILGMAGPVYFVGALLAGAWFFGTAVAAAWRRSCAVASKLFMASIGYLPIVLSLLALEAAWR